MIFNQLINLVLLVVGGISSALPVATIDRIPYAGPSIASALTYIAGLWNTFLDTFPYGLVAWHMLIWVILPFEIVMLGAKFLLGTHLPSREIN